MASRPFALISAASTNLTQVTPYAGNLAGGYILNTAATIAYLKFYVEAAPGVAPVVGTSIPIFTLLCTASVGTSINMIQHQSVTFSGPVWMATTGLAPASDTTAVAAGQLLITLLLEG